MTVIMLVSPAVADVADRCSWMADSSLLSADVGQKNLLAVFEPLICEHLNQPSRILPHLNTLIPLSAFHYFYSDYFCCFSCVCNLLYRYSGLCVVSLSTLPA